MSAEVKNLLAAIERQKKEQRLFVFLNGLDDEYSGERSQLLMQSPLPTMDFACATLQQEEAQRQELHGTRTNVEGSALHTTKSIKPRTETYASVIKVVQEEGCKVCGRTDHSSDKCWQVIGYPKGHPINKGNQRTVKKGAQNNKWAKGRVSGNKLAGNAAYMGDKKSESGTLTPHQVEQLLKLLPANSNAQKGSDTDQEIDTFFAGLSFKDA